MKLFCFSDCKKCRRYGICKSDIKGKTKKKDCDFLNIGKHENRDGTVIMNPAIWSSPHRMRPMC